MQIEIICVGKLKEDYLKAASAEYQKRLSRFCTLHVHELRDEAIPENASPAQVRQAMEKEAARIEAYLQPRDFIISLCVEGRQESSEGFAETLSAAFSAGAGRLVFIIGGSCGLADSIKSKSRIKLSFSKMTFPHQLMRVILLEQVYRAFKINAGENYHK